VVLNFEEKSWRGYSCTLVKNPLPNPLLNSYSRVGIFSKLKSLCFGDSKYIFEFKIVQVFPEKNEFELNTEMIIFLSHCVPTNPVYENLTQTGLNKLPLA
jgi:hypothetical protein